MRCRIPGKETFLNLASCEVVIFTDFLDRGLSLSGSYFFHKLLEHNDLQLHNLGPNSILHLACFEELCKGYLKIKPSLALWNRIFNVKEILEAGWVHRRHMEGNTLYNCTSSRNKEEQISKAMNKLFTDRINESDIAKIKVFSHNQQVSQVNNRCSYL